MKSDENHRREMRHRSLIDCVYVRRISLWIIDFVAFTEQRWSEVDLEFRSPKKDRLLRGRSCNSPDPVQTRDQPLNSQLTAELTAYSRCYEPNTELRDRRLNPNLSEQLEHAGRVKPFHEIYLKLWRFFICAFNNFRAPRLYPNSLFSPFISPMCRRLSS